VPDLPVLVALGAVCALLGAVGGIGGALLIVPALVLLGADAAEAAPIGLLTVGAGSLAAAPGQLAAGLVHHRLGLVVETAASAGTIAGALVSGAVSEGVLTRLLAAVALVAALAALGRRGLRNPPHATFAAELPGEWPGTLAGAYRLGDSVVPYAAQRVGPAWVAMLGAGFVSGIAGVGGGFIKTPVMSEIMRVPVKVAAATSTFTVGMTAAAGLGVFAAQGRLDLRAGAAVVAGGLAGGFVGARLQSVLSPLLVRRSLAALLGTVALVLVVRG
jgi:uncharacterized membrane protein YfcA